MSFGARGLGGGGVISLSGGGLHESLAFTCVRGGGVSLQMGTYHSEMPTLHAMASLDTWQLQRAAQRQEPPRCEE